MFFCIACIFFSCKYNNKLLEDTFAILNKKESIHFTYIYNCHCTLEQPGGEAPVGKIISKINFSELDFIKTLVKDSLHTYIIYLDFDNGTGIDIINLINSPLYPPVTKELYEELETHKDGFSLSFKDKKEFNLVLDNIIKVAKKCGASVTQN